MIAIDLFKLILSDFKKRKFSTFLTFFAISLGIMSIFVIILVSIGFENSIEKQFEQFGSNRLYITPVGSNFGQVQSKKNFSDDEIDLIKNQPYVKEVYPYFIKTAQIEYSKEFRTKQVFGLPLTEDYFKNVNMDLKEGRFVKENEKYSIMIGPTAAEDLFSKEIPIGANLYLNGTKFKVVGILESIGNPQDDSNIYFNIETIREIYGDGDRVSVADVLIQSSSDVKLAESNLKILLENRLGDDTIDVISPEQILDQLGSILDIVKFTLGGIGLVALIVGALGIINTMFVIVTEKIKDIGIMKSIGATNYQILLLFTFQAGLFGLLGAIIGVILGSGLSIGFEKLAAAGGFSFLEIVIDPLIIIYMLSFGFIVGIVSGFIPAYKASKLNIIEAIRK